MVLPAQSQRCESPQTPVATAGSTKLASGGVSVVAQFVPRWLDSGQGNEHKVTYLCLGHKAGFIFSSLVRHSRGMRPLGGFLKFSIEIGRLRAFWRNPSQR
jgi:hypothetical protein